MSGKLIGWIAAAALIVSWTPAVAAADVGSLPNTGLPALSGTPAVGQQLTCSTGSWEGEATEFGYVWLRNGNPIAGQIASTYLVRPADRGDSLACEVTATAGTGSYTISRLPTGVFDIRFRAGMLGEFGAGSVGNYATTFFQQAFAQAQATGVQVTAGGVTSAIDAQMPTGGVITGKVTDKSTGAPLEGVRVCAALGVFGAGCTETSSAGEYTLTGLETGGYRLGFEAKSDPRENFAWSESYANGATVPVEAGKVTSGIDVEIATGQISGTVTSAASKAPLVGIEVCARVPAGFEHECARTDAQGEYTIMRVHPREYDVEFSTAGFDGGNYASQYYRGASTSSTPTKVTVAAGAADAGVDAELEPGGEISGFVKSATTHMAVEAVRVCATSTSGSASSFCASTDAAGAYTIEGLASGSYKVGFSPPEDSSPDYLGNEEPSVSVTEGQTTEGVDSELQLGAQISGTVTSAATGGDLGDVRVCSLETSGVGAGYANRCTETNSGGEYTLLGVPGEQTAISFTPLAAAGNFLGQLYSGQVGFGSATKLKIEPGQSISGIDGQLLAGGSITGRVADASGAGIAGVEVCAEGAGGDQEAIRYETEDQTGECTFSSGAAASGVAISNPLVVTSPGPPQKAAFKLLKTRYDARTGKLDFSFSVPSSGRLAWKLAFDNAAAGYVVRGAAHRHGARCGKRKVSHDRRCAPVFVRLADGARDVSVGTIVVEVRPDAPARKVLAAGRVLRIDGNFELRPSGGGSETQPLAMKVKGVRCNVARRAKRGEGHASRCKRR